MSRDLRKYARNTNLQLLAGFLLILFVVGDALIYFLYGKEAAILGLTCILAGVAPLVLIALILFALDWFVKRAQDQ